jgi:PAS domain S-box-containing protein
MRRFLSFILFTATLIGAFGVQVSTALGAESGKPGKVLVVIHCDYPPVSYWDKNTNQPSGFVVDVLEDIARRTGLGVSYICKSGWAEMGKAIESGEADLGALMKSTEREKTMSFSVPIDITYLSYFARSQSSVDAAKVPEGYTVGVVRGSMSYEQLKRRVGDKLLTYGSYQDGLFGLLSGEIGLFAGEESMILKRARETHLEDRIAKIGKPFLERERGLAVKKGNVELLGRLNESLHGFMRSPEYQRIYMKWYGAPEPYWTSKRIFLVSAVFLVVVVCGMALWRYVSIVRINRELMRNITERKIAEGALQESEKKYRVLVETAKSIILTCDREGRITFLNDYAEQFFGFARGELLGRNVVGTIVPAVESSGRDLEQLMKEIWLNPDAFKDNENENITRDGRRVWVRWANRAILDEKGVTSAILSVGHDSTERKQAEEALRESEAQFMELFSNAADAIFIADMETGMIVDANEAASRLMVLPHDRIVGIHHSRLHPQRTDAFSKETFEEHKKEAEQRKPTRPVEHTVLRSDGVEVPIEVLAAMVTIRGKKCLMGTFRDITQRKKAEDKVRESEAFIRKILNTVDEGFIVIDRDYRILTANNAYCSQVGEPCEAVIGKHCYEISHKTARPCYEEGEECAVRQVFATGTPHTALHRHPDARGALLYVETKAFPIKDSTGAVTSVIETVNNITEKYLLEEERLKTQKLEAIGTLAGGIAHDFNNLLQGVFGYISMAKLSLDRAERSFQMLSQAEQALHMSVNLATQLLTFSKGGKPLKEKISLPSVIENSVRFALSGSNVDYRIRIEPDLWMVEADEGQIGQVIQNIVLNADQAMPMGGTIAITARTVRAPQRELPALLTEGPYVEISVSDTGSGIPEQYLPRLFDPYFTTKEKGSGLGLTTSYSIVRNHGGMIHVKTVLGKGSTFFVYLPAVRPEEVKSETPPVMTKTARKGRILVMDDEEVVRNIVGIMIGELGHEAELAAHGEEAVAKYREALSSGKRFDVVILDLTIRGGLGGRETIERLLAIDPAVTAVVSSGYSDDAVVSDHKTYGFKAYLAKPYRFEDLRDALNVLLG